MNKYFTLGILIFFILLLGWGVFKYFQELENERENVSLRVVIQGDQKIINLTPEEVSASGILSASITSSAIPDSALIWWEGNAWVYLEQTPGRFIKKLVVIQSFKQHYYVISGLSFPVKIVTQGAQLLLSQEQLQVMPEEND